MTRERGRGTRREERLKKMLAARFISDFEVDMYLCSHFFCVHSLSIHQTVALRSTKASRVIE